MRAALGVAVACAAAAAPGVTNTQAFAQTASGLPLAVRKAALTVVRNRVVGYVEVVNSTTAPVQPTTGSLTLRSRRGGDLTGIAALPVPTLAPKSSRSIRFGARIDAESALVSPGTYSLLMCRDVDSQLAKFVASRNCSTLGTVAVATRRHHRRGPSVPRDRSIPHTVLTAAPPRIVTSSSAGLAFTSTTRAARFQCRLDAGPWVTCSSPARYTSLVNGDHSLDVRAVTPAGTKDPAPAHASWLTAMLTPVPYMGWNPFYGVGGIFDERAILSVAQALLDRGFANAGYRIVWLDFGWASGRRDSGGNVIVDPQQWPHGMAWLTAWLHARGLQAGIYTDAGATGCEGQGVGSLGHYQQDVDTFAAWGFDAVKVDFCGAGQAGLSPAAQYQQFATALANNSSRRPMILNVDNFWAPGGIDGTNPSLANSSLSNYQWAPLLSQSWRTDTDIGTTGDVQFVNMLRNLDDNAAHPEVAGPGHWNDPDYLAPELGMSYEEAQTQFSMWAMMAAPLMLASDPRALTPTSVTMLQNPEVIAIDQDPLGVQGRPIQQQAPTQVWVKPLTGGDRAVALLNRGDAPAQIATSARAIGMNSAPTYQVRDLWQRTTGTTTGSIGAQVAPHATVLYRVHAVPPPPKPKPRPTPPRRGGPKKR